MTAASSLLLLAVVAQVALTLVVYAGLYRVRAAAVARGDATSANVAVPRDEPLDVARVRRNLANQFELPVVFYVLAVAIVAVGAAGLIDALIAWVFVLGRIAHAYIHVTSDDVRLRARVFMVGFVCVVVLAVRILVVAAGW